MAKPSTRPAALTAPSLAFLSDLVLNNNREWFQANRGRYEKAKVELEAFTHRLIQGASVFEPLANITPKECIFRINRDIRFAKEKHPYKANFAVAIGPGGRKSGRIDYYLHLQPGDQSFLGAGMWQPTPAQLSAFRQEIDYNPQVLTSLITNPAFRDYYPEMAGETLKTTPKGYAPDHPHIELLRRKELFFMHRYTDKDVIDPDFADEVLRGFKLIKPYCDYLNELFFTPHD